MSTTSPLSRPLSRRGLASVAGLAVAVTGLVAAPTGPASAASAGLVISEVYGGGGNSGATYTHDFIELFNPTSAPISVNDMSVQYRSGSNNLGGITALSGSVPAGSHYLVQEAQGSGGTTPLPAPDATGSVGMSGTTGIVVLASTTSEVKPTADAATQPAGVVDLVGYGTGATAYETAPTPTLSNTTSASRVAGDTDNNSVDFATGAPDPQHCGCAEEPPPPTEFTGTIADIQGTGAASPHVDDIATTAGVVTAAYPRGGFYGYVIQTPGSPDTPDASDAVYVYQPSGPVDVVPGDYVQVTGAVSEYKGLTELTVAKDDVTDLGDAPALVEPFAGGYPATAAGRELHESELLDVSGQRFTVTDNYSTNRYAEIGLATGERPLITPTEVADAQDAPAIAAVKADNAARGVVLDDGASIDFLPFGGGDNQDIPLPWLSTDNPARVSARASFHEPVVLDYRNNLWKLQPTHQVTDEGADVVTFEDTRSENAAPQDVGGDLRLATFNVLNYFPTTGEEFVADGGTCTYYVDRDDDPVTDNRCDPDGPRGAAEQEDLDRQQAKIVTAINKLDADIVSLEEIENSVRFGKDRDDAVATLVAALNAAAGGSRWAYVPSPAPEDLPATDEQDVIRTAFIYDPSSVAPVGDSEVLVGSAPFEDAREPLAQAFKPVTGDAATTFGVIVNHFKSKGSGVDDHTGQGNANPDRVAQAKALADFADGFRADRGIESLFLTGDFNSYSMEDPVQVLEDRGYIDLKSDTADEWTYNFDSQAGSLDHVFANDAAHAMVTGVDIWDINADEAVAFEYSRHNYNATDFYRPDQFRASDHDPAVIGIEVPPVAATVAAQDVTVAYSKQPPRIPVTVTAGGFTPTGTVTVSEDGEALGEATLSDGGAVVVLARKSLKRGEHTLTVSYSGDQDVRPGSGTVTVTVTNPDGL